MVLPPHEHVQHLIQHYGYAGIAALLALGIVGLPIPDETLLVASGIAVSNGTLNLAPTLAAACVGSMAGITVSYLLGRIFGLAVLHKYGRFLHLTPQRLERGQRWSERSGKWLLTFGYFIPGVRHVTAILAGAATMRASVFCVFSYAGAALWCTTFILAGRFFGRGAEHAWRAIEGDLEMVLQAVGLGAILALAGWYAWRHWQRRHRF